MFKIANITSVYRANLIIKAYRKWLPSGTKILDVGCGTGIVAKQISTRFKLKMSGCDTLNYLIENIPFKLIKKKTTLPYKNYEFDSIMFNDVLHHIPYSIQEQLILEALRVAKQILIFEVQPNFIGKISDYLINKIHNIRMPIPLTFRNIREWEKIFSKNKLRYEVQSVKTPAIYPFSHVAFRVSKR